MTTYLHNFSQEVVRSVGCDTAVKRCDNMLNQSLIVYIQERVNEFFKNCGNLKLEWVGKSSLDIDEHEVIEVHVQNILPWDKDQLPSLEFNLKRWNTNHNVDRPGIAHDREDEANGQQDGLLDRHVSHRKIGAIELEEGFSEFRKDFAPEGEIHDGSKKDAAIFSQPSPKNNEAPAGPEASDFAR